jgi:hypothetical protein
VQQAGLVLLVRLDPCIRHCRGTEDEAAGLFGVDLDQHRVERALPGKPPSTDRHEIETIPRVESNEPVCGGRNMDLL